jgi:catechol 2,3-dioxygenase-like lactoylglutathione lyase family enzyme
VPIIGIETLLFGVDDLPACSRFFEDLGLPLVRRGKEAVHFQLASGSNVHLHHLNSPLLPSKRGNINGVREVVWGVSTASSRDKMAEDLARDHAITRDDDGTIHFDPGFGVPMALRLFEKRRVTNAPDPLNAPDVVNRLNHPKKWRRRALPKVLSHVVFAAHDYLAAAEFMCRRLNFRISDIQESFAVYLRADGTTDHHNFLLVNASLPLPGFDGTDRFHHANFGVEDIDEIMVGVNYMQRHGWPSSEVGLGRHRIDSALFYYFPSPTGGEIELGADADQVDDSWIPRRWPVPLFAYATFVHNLLPFLQAEPEWTFEYITGDPVSILSR